MTSRSVLDTKQLDSVVITNKAIKIPAMKHHTFSSMILHYCLIILYIPILYIYQTYSHEELECWSYFQDWESCTQIAIQLRDP